MMKLFAIDLQDDCVRPLLSCYISNWGNRFIFQKWLSQTTFIVYDWVKYITKKVIWETNKQFIDT